MKRVYNSYLGSIYGEGAGFEFSVPRQSELSWRAVSPMPRCGIAECYFPVTGIVANRFRSIAEFVTRSAGRALGHEFGAHAAGLRVERRGIEIGNPVEQTAASDELVERLAFGILFG